jgi:NAD(P)-dependent dehydrogenase (short-subunit alcohol dehydrogenase family)
LKNKPVITKKSVVLVSGGARGITAQCVIKLSQRHPGNYILLGRSSINEILPEWTGNCPDDGELKRRIMIQLSENGEKPKPQSVDKQFKKIRSQQEVEGTLSSIRQAGSNVEYVDVDVTDMAMMKERLAEPIQRFGNITGVIHGAGSLADRRIEKKTEKDYETVISPKIDGLKNLLNIAPVKNLDFLVLFSSIVGVYGNVGQTDYAIANEVLNKAAYQAKRENPNCRVLSINWGPWDSGMVTPELKRAFAERNMEVIPTDAGAELMVNEITSLSEIKDDPIQIVVGAIPTRQAGPQSTDLKKYLISRNLSLDANPFLLDHKIGSNPVLPATCAASWAASACEQLYPGYTFFQLEDYKVLKGIVFDESLAKEHILELTETEKTPEGKLKFSAKIFSLHKNGKPLFHYSLNVVLLQTMPPSPVHVLPVNVNNLEQDQIKGDTLYHDGTLFHGPAFQGVKRILDISKGRIILECNLPSISPEQQGQFPLQTSNPFIYDAIVQSLLIWTQIYYQSPCLPSQLARLEQYKAIPFEQTCLVDLQIVSHSDTSVVADIHVIDSKGNVYVKFSQLQGTISPLLKRFIGVKAGINPGASNV